jgi:hypothetical protein
MELDGSGLLELRGEEQGVGAAMVEGGWGGASFIEPEDESGGNATMSNDRRWWMFSMLQFLGRGRGDRAISWKG